MSGAGEKSDHRLGWRDYVAIVVAMFETVLVPVLVVLVVLIVIALFLFL